MVKEEPIRVLLVEDNPAQAAAIQRALLDADANVQVRVAGTLAAYRQAASDCPPDAAIMDLNLSDGSALEVLTSPPEVGPFPILIMTSCGNEQGAVEALKAGASDCVVKSPETFFDMPRSVERAMREWNLLQERKRAEEKLNASEAQYRRLFETAKDGILILDAATGMVIDVNPFLIELLGFTHEHFLGKPIWELGFLKDIIANQVKFLELQQQEYVRYDDLPLETADGRKIQVEFISNVYPVGDHKVIQCNIRNISERKRTEEKLSISETQYRRLFETAKDGILILDAATGMVIDVNPFLIEMLGFTHEHFLGKTIWELGFLKDIIANQVKFLELQQQEYVRYDDLPLETADGRKIQVEFIGNVYPVGNRKVIQCNIRNISERKHAERDLQILSSRNQAMLEAIPDIIMEVDATKVYTWANHAGIKFFGADVIGKEANFYFEGEQQTYLAVKPIFNGQEEVIYVESWQRRHDGEKRLLAWWCRVLKDGSSNISGALSSARDITEINRAENEIHLLNEELEQKVRQRTGQLEAANKELEAFSYSVSHDLRAPLRAIDGFSRIVLEEYAPKLDDEGRRLLDVIAANTHKMGQLIDDLLAFSRLSRQQIAFAQVDLAALADDVFSELKNLEKGRRIELEIGALPAAFGDRSMLRQVLQNLLANAIKFTRTRTRARIEFGGQQTIGETIYYIKDNGVGFAMDYVDKLFGVFQRLHGADEFEGSGVGLAIVQRIVQRHGGRVWAKSGKRGATFYFALPTEQGTGDKDKGTGYRGQGSGKKEQAFEEKKEK